jgi:mannose-6-phosphate isomerase-like protein (cupin superfamily)
MQVHEHSDQVMLVQDGEGTLVVDGIKRLFKEDDLVLIDMELKHNVINNGKKDMKIISIYTHPEFLDKTKHKSRQDADEESMEQDEDFDY